MTPRRSTVAAIIGGYNLVQNVALPTSLYVPANLVVSAGLIALARRTGCGWDDLGLDPPRAKNGAGLGAAVAGGVAVGALAALSRPSLRQYLLDERSAGQGPGDIVFRSLVRFPLGTALFEEIAFRGVVEAVWRRDGATESEAAVAAAVMFALWHLMPTRAVLDRSPATSGLETSRSRAGAILVGAAATGLASLGLTWMRRRSRSLVAPWMAHTAFNVAGYLAGVAAWRLHEHPPSSG